MLCTDASWIPFIIKNGKRYLTRATPKQRDPTALRFPDYKMDGPSQKKEPKEKGDLLSFQTRKPPNKNDED